MTNKIPQNPFKFGLFASKPYLKWAIPALIFVFLATAVDRFHVIILRNLTDALAKNPLDFAIIWFWGLVFPLAHFIGRTLWRSSGFMGMKWFTNLRAHSYQSLYNYLTLHSKDYFNNRFAGALSSKVSNAVEGTRGLYERTLWEFIPLMISLVSYAVIAFIENSLLGAILLVWSVIFLTLNFFLALKMKSYSVKFALSMSILRGKIVDSLSNISLVHENAFVGGERQYIKKYVDKQTKASLSQWWFSEWVLVLNGFMITLFMLLMIVSSLYLFQNKFITVGVVIMVIAIVVDLSQALFAIGQQFKQVAREFGEAREGLQEILSEHIIIDSKDAENFNITKGHISIESVDFDYDSSKVFRNFTLNIPAGQKVGLVGKSGAGKTTFVSLLLRHFEVLNGDIKIDGKSISRMSLDSLRRGIAFVPQDTSLFHRTISENIGYSRSEASQEEIERAAKLAQANDFIKKLPNGYQTLVGERGVKLSGGQRQRVAIARAFLKNSPILILDEATSSLDSASEHAIQMSLNNLMKNKTVIAIAHRLSTLKKMDRIIFIDQGKIAEDGTPEELLKKPNGLFKQIWDHQVKGFIVE